MKLTREQILRNRLEMAQHNLNCYSADYMNTKAKAGCEAEFEETAAEVEMLKIWLKEFHRTNSNSTREFIGHINGWSHGKTYDGRILAENLRFEVDTGASYCYGDERMFNIAPEVQDWFISADGRCGKYDIEKDHRNSRLVKITVDTIEYVRTIEWVIAE